jgi:hypothetical protein
MMFEIATMTRLSMFNPNVPPNQTFPPNWSSSETPMPWKHHWIFMDTGFFWVVSSCFIHLFDGYIGYIGYIPTSLHRAIGQWWPMRWWVASLGAVLGLNKEEAPWPWEWRQPNSSAVDWWYGVILWYIYIYLDIGILKDFIPKLAILQHFTQENGGSNNRHGGCNITHTNLTNINRDFIKQEVYRLDCFSP